MFANYRIFEVPRDNSKYMGGSRTNSISSASSNYVSCLSESGPYLAGKQSLRLLFYVNTFSPAPGTNSALVSIKCMSQHAMGLGPLWSTDNKLSPENLTQEKQWVIDSLKHTKLWLLMPLQGTEINSQPKNITKRPENPCFRQKQSWLLAAHSISPL